MNIKEIARKSGVSVATVSRVLNHPENVAVGTKERILQVIEESEYTPNWFARSLNFNRTNTIGLLLPDILNPGYMEIAKGVEDVAHQKDFTTLLCNCENALGKERQYIDTLLKRKVDGIVLVSSLLEDEDFQNIKNQGMPMIFIGEYKGNVKETPVVKIDYKNAAYRAVSHLIENGYDQIAMLHSRIPKHENEAKVAGYRHAIEEARLLIDARYIVEVGGSLEEGYIAAKKLLDSDRPPRAFFTSSDMIAIGVIEALKDYEIAIPDQIAVIGFDNIQMSNLIEPKLTTVAKPMHKMGVVGARLLFDIIDNKDEDDRSMPKEILLQSKLKIRKSCGHNERIGEMF